VLFKATPVGKPRAQVTNIIQINGSLLLDPPAAQRRVAFAAEPIRAEPAGSRRLRVLVPVENRGNVYTRANGTLAIRSSSGAVVARAALKGRRILPGATVELPAVITKPLPAGSYALSAAVRGPRRPLEGVALIKPMKVDRAAPGKRGEMHAELELPGAAPAYELTVRLSDGRRELDARTVAVTPTKRPGLATRAKNFVTDHALVMLGGLLMVIIAGAAFGVRYVRRLKAAAQRPE